MNAHAVFKFMTYPLAALVKGTPQRLFPNDSLFKRLEYTWNFLYDQSMKDFCRPKIAATCKSYANNKSYCKFDKMLLF